MTDSAKPQPADEVKGAGQFLVVLRAPGAFRFTSAGFFTRLPLATTGLALMLLNLQVHGSYTLGGIVVAVFVISRAVFAPFLGRMIDRYGQARVMSKAVATQVVGLSVLTVAILQEWNFVLVLAIAVLAGVGTGSPPALVRSRWANLLTNPRSLTTAFSWESIVESTAFIIGPILVAFIATLISPVLGIAFAITALIVGSVMLYSQKSTEPVPQPHAERGSEGAMTRSSFAFIMVCAAFYFCAAVALGAVDVYAVALTSALDAPWAAGFVIALLTGGSMISAIFYGSINWTIGPRARLWWVTGLFIVSTLTLPFCTELWMICPVIVVIGVSFSAVLTTSNLAAKEAAPASRLTEVLTWMTTALGLGVSAGNFGAGLLIDNFGALAGAWAVAGGGAVALLVWLIRLVFISDRRSAAAEAAAAEAVTVK